VARGQELGGPACVLLEAEREDVPGPQGHQDPGGPGRVSMPGLAQQALSDLVDPPALIDRHRADGMVRLPVLGGRVHERAAAVLVDHPVLGERHLPGVQGGQRVAGVAVDDRLHCRPCLHFAVVQVRKHQVVFRREVPVKGHPGYLRLLDEPLHADRLDAVAVEQAVRGREDPVPG
jgi:hypothetical protein